MDVVEFRLKREDAELIRSAVYNYALTLRIDQDVIFNHSVGVGAEEKVDEFISMLSKRERSFLRLLRRLDDILDD